MADLWGGIETVRRSEMMGSSTEPTVLDKGAMPCIAAGLAKLPPRPTNLARSVSQEMFPALALAALTHHEMQQPRRLFFMGTRAAGAENGGGFSREFGLHEEIAESRMRRVRGRKCEHHFRITGQFDDARTTDERLVIVMRRNSTSSSGDTLISVWISSPA
jgi:hypothetical protein